MQLTLSDEPVGEIAAVAGGAVVADVVVEERGASAFAKKHLGQTRYEELTLRAGLGLSEPFYEWVSASWRARLQRHDGVITTGRGNGGHQVQTEFFGAVVSQTMIPPLRVGSREPGLLGVTLAAEYLRHRGGGPVGAGSRSAEQAPWLSGDFRLEIDGLQASSVTGVGAIVVRCAAPSQEVGKPRDVRGSRPTVAFSDFVVSLPEAAAESWIAWHQDFVVRGDSGEGREKIGRLTLLSPGRERALARIGLFGLGISGLGRGPHGSGHDELLASLYCERMEFAHEGA